MEVVKDDLKEIRVNKSKLIYSTDDSPQILKSSFRVSTFLQLLDHLKPNSSMQDSEEGKWAAKTMRKKSPSVKVIQR